MRNKFSGIKIGIITLTTFGYKGIFKLIHYHFDLMFIYYNYLSILLSKSTQGHQAITRLIWLAVAVTCDSLSDKLRRAMSIIFSL